nr:hypothetical protein [Tanacetum cinerariifolium]GEW31412.1 hypothetical protein [Tanacetum cinerariifolium]
MSSSAIHVPTDSSKGSVGSFAPLIILFDTDVEATTLLDSSEEDAPDPHEATVARWRAAVMAHSSSSSSYSASTPPASLQIVPVVPGLPRLLAILVLPGQEIPFGRTYRTYTNGVLMMLTARMRVHLYPARIPANRRRFHYSSSSPLPRKRRRVSPHSSSLDLLSSSSSSNGMYHKRGRLPTTSLSVIACSPAVLSPVQANLLPPHKRFSGSSFLFHQEVSIEDSTEVGYEASIKDGIKTGYEVTVEATAKRIEEVQEETGTLTSRFETAKTERTSLRERVRALELSILSLQDALRVEREREIYYSLTLFGVCLRGAETEQEVSFVDRKSLRRIETFMIKCFGYHP